MITDEVRGAAFHRLLATRAAISPAQLATDLNRPEHQVRAAIDLLHRDGLARLDPGSRVVGAAGLNVRPDRHQITLNGQRYWTWCAYDFLGIFAALQATGQARTTTPDAGDRVSIHFSEGRPDPAELVLFLPNEDYAATCTSAYDQWCPHSNLFHNARAATAWAAEHAIPGAVLTLPEAADRGRARWQPLVNANPGDQP